MTSLDKLTKAYLTNLHLGQGLISYVLLYSGRHEKSPSVKKPYQKTPKFLT